VKILTGKNLNLLIWCAIYSGYAFAVYSLYFVQRDLNFYAFLEASIFDIRNYFYDISIFFIAYLFILKKPFNSPMFISRCKESYLIHILIYGLKICLFFVLFMAVLFYCIPILGGVEVWLDSTQLLDFANLFSFLYTTYLLYIVLLLLCNIQMYSLLGGLAVNFSVHVVLFFLRITNEPLSSQIASFLRTSYAGIAIVFLIALVLIFRKKDFIT